MASGSKCVPQGQIDPLLFWQSPRPANHFDGLIVDVGFGAFNLGSLKACNMITNDFVTPDRVIKLDANPWYHPKRLQNMLGHIVDGSANCDGLCRRINPRARSVNWNPRALPLNTVFLRPTSAQVLASLSMWAFKLSDQDFVKFTIGLYATWVVIKNITQRLRHYHSASNVPDGRSSNHLWSGQF